MSLFEYKGYTMEGRSIKGLIEAADSDAARKRLENDYILTLIHEKKTKIPKTISQKELINFTDGMTRLIKAGVSVHECLQILEQKYAKTRFYSILINFSHDVQEGCSLSMTLRKYPHIFSKFYCTMIENAETSGNLLLSFKEIGQFLKKQDSFKKKLFGVLFYPAILLTFSLFVFSVLLFYVVPSLAPLFEGRKLHPLTGFILRFSQFMIMHKNSVLFLLMSFVGGGVMIHFSQSLKDQFKRALFKIWGIRDLWLRINIMRFCRSNAALLEGGVPLIKSLNLSNELITIPALKIFFRNVEKNLLEGRVLSKELQHPLIPTLMYRFIAIAEESGKFDQMFHQLASNFEDDLEKDFQKLTTILQPAILLLLGGIIGFVLLAVLLPLTDVNSFINS